MSVQDIEQEGNSLSPDLFRVLRFKKKLENSGGKRVALLLIFTQHSNVDSVNKRYSEFQDITRKLLLKVQVFIFLKIRSDLRALMQNCFFE